MSSLLREPLLQFLVLGAGIFLLYDALQGDGETAADEIVISVADIERMSQSWRQTRRRPPTQDELEGMIRDHIREEIYYREALALGLDRDNAVIRGHLRQKLEFLTDDIAAQGDPTDAELEQFLAANPAKFAREPQFRFRHVYFSAASRGDSARADATEALARVRAGDDVSALGDRWLYAPADRPMSVREISRMFGAALAEALAALPAGQWQGPFASTHGQHIVVIDERVEARVPALDEIRSAVEREWRETRRQAAADEYYETLRERYDVVVERPAWLDGELGIDDVTLR